VLLVRRLYVQDSRPWRSIQGC